MTVYPGMFAISENAFVNVKNTSFSITAYVDVNQQPANGLLIDQGGRFGGWAFYVKDGKPIYHYNFLGLKPFSVASEKSLPTSKSTIRFDFAYDGGGPGKGGVGKILVNGEKVAEGRIDVTQFNAFSATEGADVGLGTGTPVSEDYQNPFAFNGKIEKVTIDLIDDRQSGEVKAAIAKEQADANMKRKLAD